MPTLADAILEENLAAVRQLLRYNDVNQIDEYGFTPLIEAAIVNNVSIAEMLLAQGANPNLQDVTGGTPLQWAVENNNPTFCKLLLQHRANPNSYNFAGQPVLVMALLRRQSALRQLLVQAGADLVFAQDYINTKLLGHIFELAGMATIVSPTNQFVDVDFEGFFLEITLGLVADSVAHFQNHFAARQLRRYAGLSQYIVEILMRADQLIRWQQYRTNLKKHEQEIANILQQEPLIIPVGYEGHAITFIKLNNIWVKCDRREDSRLFDNIMFYYIGNSAHANKKFLFNLLYKKQDFEFINQELDMYLELRPITELKVEAQVSGNCTWANVEACIPAIFFLVLMHYEKEEKAMAYNKTLALNFFHRWREWNKDRALDLCIQAYKEGDVLRKACKAEILTAILFQRCDPRNAADRNRIESILKVLLGSPYEYLIKNYLRVYYYEGNTEEGKLFAELIKEYKDKLV